MLEFADFGCFRCKALLAVGSSTVSEVYYQGTYIRASFSGHMLTIGALTPLASNGTRRENASISSGVRKGILYHLTFCALSGLVGVEGILPCMRRIV